MRIAVLIITFLLTALTVPTAGVALGQGTPAPTAESDYFPTLEQLGDDWIVRQTLETKEDLDTDIFQTFVKRRYGGPGGTRAAVDVRPLTDAPGAMLRGWALITAEVDTLAFGYEGGYASTRELASVPPPEGCLDARRITGADDNGYPVAVTFCAREDVILTAFVSGELPNLAGHRASDQLIAWSLESSST